MKTLAINDRVTVGTCKSPGTITKVRRYKSGVRYFVHFDDNLGTWIKEEYVTVMFNSLDRPAPVL